jgi:hypothetical protein
MQTSFYRKLRDLELPLEFRIAAWSLELESAWNSFSGASPDVLKLRAETRAHDAARDRLGRLLGVGRVGMFRAENLGRVAGACGARARTRASRRRP